MATVQLKLGPADHGRQLSLDDFESAEYEPGHKYEIIDGGLYVSPEANFSEHALERWLVRKLDRYAENRPDVINFVANKSRVFVADEGPATVPEPDVALYRDLPLDQDLRTIHWRELDPVIVAEVLVEGDEHKDLTRNPPLYLEVPSIREYWVLDGRDNPNEPTLIRHRRHGRRWVVRKFPYGSTFASRLLPGFELVIDPRQ